VDGLGREPHAGEELGLRASLLFAATGIMVAVTVAGLRIAGYRPGVLDDRVEWVFWAGAILGAAGVGMLGLAAIPGRASARSIATGILLFLVAPVLCAVAVFTDYWI
jgi:drug/metabolite transporter (DMT)-like permease